MTMLKSTFLLVLVLFTEDFEAFTAPIRIRMGQSSDENHGQHNNGVVYEINSGGGVKHYHDQDEFDRNAERKFIKAADTSNYGEQHQDNKHKLDEGQFAQDDFKEKGGSSVSDYGVDNNHKKGHHKSGFHNTYHKDESGSNSSYFDDNKDQGGEYVRNSQRGAFGEKGGGSNRGSYLDGNRYHQAHGKHGGYDNGGHYDKELEHTRKLKDEGHRLDQNRRGQSNSANRFGGGGHYNEEKYYQPELYREPYYNDNYHGSPGYSKSTITVYEDPRYSNRRQYNRYDRDSVHKEYGPYYVDDTLRYDVRRPYEDRGYNNYRARAHDDYYY